MVSKGRTPEAAGAHPCQHCGSPKHWDYECKHACQGAKRVRANFADPSPDYTEAQDAFDTLYYEDKEEEVPVEENLDFPNPSTCNLHIPFNHRGHLYTGGIVKSGGIIKIRNK